MGNISWVGATLSESALIPHPNPGRTLSFTGDGSAYKPELVWYTIGGRAEDSVAKIIEKDMRMLDAIYKNMALIGKMQPTTWEAASAYLSEEVKKPIGQRDLSREYAFFVPIFTGDAGDEFYIVMHETKTVFEVALGEGFAYPAIDCPPWMLDGTPETAARVDFITKSGKPVDMNVMATYFTRTTEPGTRGRPEEGSTDGMRVEKTSGSVGKDYWA